MTSIVVRLAVPDDIERIVAMGRDFVESTKYAAVVGVNPDAMRRLVTHLVGDTDSDVLVLEALYDRALDNSIVGMLGLTQYLHPIAGEMFATELFWWVDPAFRGRGVRLLYAAERWARSRGARAFQMIAPTPEVAAIYGRLGYAEVETSYQKQLV